MPPKILVVAATPPVEPGAIGAGLAAAGAVTDLAVPSAPLPAAGTVAGLLAIDATRPENRDGAALAPVLAAAVAADLPVLALGGAALSLAEALGGGSTPGTAPQFGFIDVEALPAAKADASFAPAGNGLPLLHWHDAGLVLPPGAELLLRCERLRPQAFRHGRSYGVLAHLEATGEVIRRWAADLGRRRNNPAFAIRLSGELDRHQARAERFAAALAQAWAQTLREG
ncbi:MAG: hypothetical protein U1E14_18455 [Geminicoccaceae bacterium]